MSDHTQKSDNHTAGEMPEFFTASDFDPGGPIADDGQRLCTYEWAAKRANAKLSERGVRVYGYAAPDSAYAFRATQESDDTHRALLIAVEPIVRESAEDVLRDFNAWLLSGSRSSLDLVAIGERARRVLEGGAK